MINFLRDLVFQLEKLDLEINRVKGQITILVTRLEVLQKDVKLSPAEIKDMEVLEVRNWLGIFLKDL